MGDFGGAGAANQSQAFAAALQRAKQIAAKIQPNQPQANNVGPGGGGGGGGGFKRSHDDGDSGPENKRFTSPDGNDYGGGGNSNMSSGSASAGGPGNMTQALAQAAAVAARLAATAGNTCEEQVRIPDSLMGSFYGRTGNDTISHIQGESGCKIQMGQEGERIITLRGSRETVSKGKDVMQQMSNRSGGGIVEVVLTINMPPPGPTGYPPYQEIMIPGTKVGLIIGKGGDTIKQLQEKTGAKMVIIQEGPNEEVIKPLRISGDPQKIEHAKQMVLELIAQKDSQPQPSRPSGGGGGGASQGGGPNGNYNNFGAGANGGGGGGGGPGSNGADGNYESCEVFVPKIAVGVVIGKGGDMIRKIQLECGGKLQFLQGKNDEPGDRRCFIQGTKQQVEQAKRTIEGLIENVMTRSRNGNGPNTGNSVNSEGGYGSGGGGGGGSNYGYGYGVNHAQQSSREEITFMVPNSKCGIVIGRGGETIKLINQQTGAYCEMDRIAVNPPSEKLFKCKGTPEQVEAARQMIAEKINMELPIISRKPISGGPPHQQNQQQAYNPNDPNAAAAAYQQQWAGYGQSAWGDQSQQPGGMGAPGGAAGQQSADFSQQWIEYYKSMGMTREAEMIEQQLKAKQVTPAVQPQVAPAAAVPQASAAPAGGQTQDFSAQWAEYYRSIGKIEEAEAIEKQMKGSHSSSSAAGNPPSGNMAPSSAASGNIAPAAANNSSSSSGGGGGGQTKDFSVQWAEYYRSIGKIEEAEAIEKQMKNQNSNAAPSAPANPMAAGGAMTPSQYAQYSQYYAAAAQGMK